MLPFLSLCVPEPSSEDEPDTGLADWLLFVAVLPGTAATLLTALILVSLLIW